MLDKLVRVYFSFFLKAFIRFLFCYYLVILDVKSEELEFEIEDSSYDNVNFLDSYIEDPFENYNRYVYKYLFTNNSDADKKKNYFYNFFKYLSVTFNDFFENTQEPFYVYNNFLQGRLDKSIISGMRFVINSTIGVFGYFDVANYLAMPRQTNDLGLTLAKYGVGNGIFLVSFNGPTTTLDLTTFLTETFMDFFLNPVGGYVTIFRLGSYGFLYGDKISSSVNMTLDPYTFVKISYIQYRKERLITVGKKFELGK